MNLEDILENIDSSFKEKKQQEIYMTYGMIAAGIIFLSYYFLFDSAEQGYNRTVAEVKKVEKKLSDDEKYIKWNPVTKIAQIKNQTEQGKQKFVELKDKSEYIKYKIEQISSLYYDAQAWGSFIDSISENAKKYKVKLKYLSNSFSDEKGSFGHILDIEVKVDGEFHRTMKFINSLEQSFLVVDIHNAKLKASKEIETELKISVWGITY